MTKGAEINGVRVKSACGRWAGERVIRRTSSCSEALKTPSALEGRTVFFREGGLQKVGKVSRRQVPLVLELALTVHKAQGMALRNAVFDLGCGLNAYSGGLAYTAITRVQKLGALWFIGAPAGEKELMRLIQACANAVREIRLCRKSSAAVAGRARLVYEHMKKIIEE